MKLEKEITTDRYFCSSIKRPKVCLKNNNLCCMLCDLQKDCLKENEQYNTPPCIGDYETLKEEGCVDLI